jgi:hypothetical protein
MKNVAAIAVLGLLVSGGLFADETILHTGVVSSGGSSWAESANYGIQFSVGQTCIGVAATASNEGDAGFWYVVWTGAAPADYIGVPWSWIAVPFHPMFPDPRNVLGYDCGGGLWRWDKYGKTTQVFKPPFVLWDMETAEGYLTYAADVPDPVYHSGFIPFRPYEYKLGRMGWTWLGMPSVHELGYPDFMPDVRVRYPSDQSGTERTAAEDRAAGDDAWVSWGWSFWDTGLQAPKTFSPYAPFGNNVCHPWVGYRAWIRIGNAMDEDDPDQVTLIWP